MIFLFRWGFICFAILWSMAVLPAEVLRVSYAEFRETLSSGRAVDQGELNAAIVSYEKVASMSLCMPGVREQLAFFLSKRSATYSGIDAMDKMSDDLNKSDEILRDMLACSPFESNQWLSMAMLENGRIGINDKIFTSLNLSYLTAPREGWIIERRLTFAASISPFLPASLGEQIRSDVETMRHQTMGQFKHRFLTRLNLKTLDEFELLFD